MIIYIDPLRGGHHPELLVFFATIFDAQGWDYEVHVPAGNWQTACREYPALAGRPFHAIDGHFDETGGRGQNSASLRALVGDIHSRRGKSSGDLYFLATLDPFLGALRSLSLSRALTFRWAGLFLRDGFNAVGAPLPLGLRLRALSKLWLLKGLTRQGCTGIMTLNPFWQAKLACPVVWLPDSLSQVDRGYRDDGLAGVAWPRPANPRADGRTSFLIYGGMSPRKGITEFLCALTQLEPADLERVHLNLIGPASDKVYLAEVERMAADLRQRGALIDSDFRYVTPQELADALQACDVVVAPYQNHVGSSGVIGQAVQVGRPVLGQGQHQMGAEIQAYDLGFATKGPGVADLTVAIRHFLTSPVTVSAGMASLHARRNFTTAQAAATAFLKDALKV